MNLIEACSQKCKEKQKRIVFPDAKDERVLKAARYLKDEELAFPILIGGPFEIRDIADQCKVSTKGIEIINPQQCPDIQKFAKNLYELRKQKGMTESEAKEIIMEPLYFSAMLTKNNGADVCIGGNMSTTANVLKAAIQVIGMPSGVKTVSSFFLMIDPKNEQIYLFSDCAVIPEPTSEQLSDITYLSSKNFESITGIIAKAAMLSFSTKGSANHPSIERIREGLKIIKDKYPDMIVDGELQFDAAFVPEVAKKKAPDSVLKGEANVFIFPSLAAGNIGYKVAERLGGLMALGPFIQGLQKPMHDLSRGCNWKDIVNIAVISSCM